MAGDGFYCEHNRMADACEDCLAQGAGLKDAQDGPAARLPGREEVVATSAKATKGKSRSDRTGPDLH